MWLHNSHSGELDNETLVETYQQWAYEEIKGEKEAIDDPAEIQDMKKIFALLTKLQLLLSMEI